MREQLTTGGIALLIGAIVVFWITVAALVRLHARGARDPGETTVRETRA
ncbi:hypothetical protein BH23GEM9_BH23GEM9_26340 [soil metagenome]